MHSGSFFGCQDFLYRVPGPTTFFSVIFGLVEVDLHVMGFGMKVIETFKSLGHERS